MTQMTSINKLKIKISFNDNKKTLQTDKNRIIIMISISIIFIDIILMSLSSFPLSYIHNLSLFLFKSIIYLMKNNIRQILVKESSRQAGRNEGIIREAKKNSINESKQIFEWILLPIMLSMKQIKRVKEQQTRWEFLSLHLTRQFTLSRDPLNFHSLFHYVIQFLAPSILCNLPTIHPLISTASVAMNVPTTKIFLAHFILIFFFRECFGHETRLTWKILHIKTVK